MSIHDEQAAYFVYCRKCEWAEEGSHATEEDARAEAEKLEDENGCPECGGFLGVDKVF